jgi:hypothetical protein
LYERIGECVSKGREIDNNYYSNGIVAPINLNTEQYYEVIKHKVTQFNTGDILYKNINIYENALYLLVHTDTKGEIDHIKTMRCMVGQEIKFKNGVYNYKFAY